MTLENYIKKLQEICKEHPSFAKLPVIYSIDEEGNDYHMVLNEPVPVQVYNIDERNLEMINYFNGDKDDPDNSAFKNINCILIN